MATWARTLRSVQWNMGRNLERALEHPEAVFDPPEFGVVGANDGGGIGEAGPDSVETIEECVLGDTLRVQSDGSLVHGEIAGGPALALDCVAEALFGGEQGGGAVRPILAGLLRAVAKHQAAAGQCAVARHEFGEPQRIPV